MLTLPSLHAPSRLLQQRLTPGPALHGHVEQRLQLPNSSSSRRRVLAPRAQDSSRSSEQPSSGRYEDAIRALGVQPGASFDQILLAKNSLLAASSQDAEARQRVEAAYDVILNGTLRRRLRGEMDVSLNVRFADAGPRRLGPAQRMPSPTNAARPARSSQQQQQQHQHSGGGSSPTSTLTILEPREGLAVQHVAVFGALGTWALVQAALEPPAAQLTDFSCVQLSLAIAYSSYSLMDSKRLGAGRAVALSLAILLMGYLLGIVVDNVMQLDVHPVATFHSPNTLYSEFGVLALLLGSLVLL